RHRVFCGYTEIGGGDTPLWVSRIYLRTSMRRQPYSLASIDQAPGPSMTSAAPIAITRRPVERLGEERPHHNPDAAMSDADTGVQIPASRRPATAIEARSSTNDVIGGAAPRCMTAAAITTLPTAALRTSSPTPGAPPAKVEKRRRRPDPGCSVSQAFGKT